MKFLALMKKELKEMITLQTIIPMAITLVAMVLLGQFMGGIFDEATNGDNKTITVVDLDKTAFTGDSLDMLAAENNLTISYFEAQPQAVLPENHSTILEQSGAKQLLIIPQGFTAALTEEGPSDSGEANILTISQMGSISMSSMMNSTDIEGLAADLKVICNKLALASLTDTSIEAQEELQNLVGVVENTVVMDKSATVSKSAVSAIASSQSMIVPIIVFVMIIMAAQMTVTAISTEKLDKTLETLLSTPVPRIMVLGAKVVAAAVTALLNAVVYMVAFSSMMFNINSVGAAGMNMADTSAAIMKGTTMDVPSAMMQLGLTMMPTDYILLGVQLFLSILIALSISLMLGVLVEDAKSAQTVIMPLMLMAMIPYFISLFSSVGELPGPLQVVLFIIPFTHTYSATNNILFNHMGSYWLGLGYQVVFLGVCMLGAVKLFTSDKLFTVSLNLGQKKKFKLSSKKLAK